MALELAPQLIREVPKQQGAKVQVTAIAEQGRVVIMPNKAAVTTARLVQAPEIGDQIEVVARGHCTPLLNGGSVLVFGQITVGGIEFGTRIVATQVKPAGEDGAILGFPHADEECALCQYQVDHAH